MTIRVRLPDGSTVNVNTDDPKAASAAAQRYYSTKQKAPAKKAVAPKPKATAKPKSKGFWGTVADFAGDITDNALPNWGDEVAGFGGGLGSLIQGRPYMEGYKNQSDRFLRDQKRYDDNHPALAWGSTIAGQGVGLAAPAGKVAKGATLGKKAVTGAKVGAAYGAVAGAGQGEGLVERGENAATGAAFGATVGAALPPVMAAGQKGAQWAARNVPGVEKAASTIAAVPRAIWQKASGRKAPTAAEAQANRMLAEHMNIGNISDGNGMPGAPASPEAIAAEVERRNRMGVPAMVGDVTENMRGMTEYASRGIGPGQSLVRRSIEGRKAGEAQRVRQHVAETFPTVDDPIRFVEERQRAAKEAAAPLYQEAYGQPVFRTPEMQGIEQTPAFRKALPQAFENIQNQIDEVTGKPKSPQAMGFRWFDGDPQGLPPNVPYFPHPSGRGYVALDKGLSTEGYDQVIRAMNDSGRAAAHVNPVTGRVENTTNSVHINNRARDLRSQLVGQNDPYARAVGGYGDDMTYVDAFRSGQDVGKLTGHEINAQRRNTPDFAQDTWAAGAGTAMADQATQYGAKYPNGAAANSVRQMLGDETKQAAVGEMSGNTGGVRQLLDRLEYEHQGHQNWQGVNGNSKTAQRRQLDSDLDASSGIPMSKSDLVTRFVGFVTSRAAPKLQQDVKARIAEVVTASDAKTIEQMLQAISDQAERDKSFRDLMHKAGIAATKAYAMNIQGSAPTNEQ